MAVFGRTFFPVLRIFIVMGPHFPANSATNFPARSSQPFNWSSSSTPSGSTSTQFFIGLPVMVELFDVRLLQCLLALFGTEPDDQRILPDADEQVAVQEEADAAEHLLLFDVLAPSQSF